MSYHILVVDDDSSIREALERGFRLEGFPVSSVANGEAALREVEENIPGLIILDVNMPGMNGIQVTRYLRSINVDIPICVLSARDEVADRISGLEAGADDYMVKPFAFEELVARVRALLRRHKVISTNTINVGELNVDPQRRVVSYFDRELTLTKKEFDLLYVLANNADVVLSRYQLLEHVWGYDFEVDTNVVDVFIGYLRKKMEENGQPRILETIRGVGFMLRK
jgi:two-component system response regulator PrrA